MPDYFSGLDLGQAQDYSALVVIERGEIPDPDRGPKAVVNRFDVRHIHRWHLGTPYPAIIADLGAWFGAAPLRNTTLVVDGTGVGRPVVDMIEASQLPADVRPYSITAGMNVGDGTVPKKDLVGSVQAALQTRRLRFAEELTLRPVLEKELETFRVKVTADRNETFAAWRERDHDDIVLALALALWYGELNSGGGALAVPGEPHLPAHMGKVGTATGW